MHANLLKSFWAEAFINRLPSTVLKMETPIFKLFGAHPAYSSLYLEVGVFLSRVIGEETNLNQNYTPVFSSDMVLYTKDFVAIIPTVKKF